MKNDGSDGFEKRSEGTASPGSGNRETDMPLVYLVGAGPGPEDLITVKGIQCVKKADIILYDPLVSSQILEQAADGTACIPVADRKAGREEVVRQLMENHQAAKTVVRLMAGDPFAFNSGGEEVLALEQEGIPYEVVPGIPAATAIPACAGIPVTHRGMSTGFQVASDLDAPASWAEYWTKPPETLVIQVDGGWDSLENLVASLLESGKSPDLPAALVQQGASMGQRTISGTLSNLMERGETAGLKPPWLLVTGNAVLMQPALSWMERKPLFGLRVMVTRSQQQSGILAEKLAWQGAVVRPFSTIEARFVVDHPDTRAVMDRLDSYKHLVFTSPNGVEGFLAALKNADKDLRYLSPATAVIVIGQATARAAERAGLKVIRMHRVFTTEGLLENMKETIEAGHTVLLPRSDTASPQLAAGLKELGALVDDIPVYEATIPPPDSRKIRELRENPPDWLTFTSTASVHHFMKMLEQAQTPFPAETTQVAVIGPTTASAVEQYGVRVEVIPREQTIDGLVTALCRGTAANRRMNRLNR